MRKYQITLTVLIYVFVLLTSYLIAKDYSIAYLITSIITSVLIYLKGFIDRCQVDLTEHEDKLNELQNTIDKLKNNQHN